MRDDGSVDMDTRTHAELMSPDTRQKFMGQCRVPKLWSFNQSHLCHGLSIADASIKNRRPLATVSETVNWVRHVSRSGVLYFNSHLNTME